MEHIDSINVPMRTCGPSQSSERPMSKNDPVWTDEAIRKLILSGLSEREMAERTGLSEAELDAIFDRLFAEIEVRRVPRSKRH